MNTVRAAVIVALAVTGVTCNDLQVGSSHGRIVFNETIQASPAIWRQSQQITINVTDQEIISSVVVTDHREEKDGEAKIVEGGEGQQNVTIELKSPTVFRGFDFNVVVYAAEGHVHPLNDAQHPVTLTKDTDVNTSAKPEDKNIVKTVTPVTEKLGHEGPTPPALTGDLPRKYRNTEQQTDHVVKFVTEKTNDVNQVSTTFDPKKLATERTNNGPASSATLPTVGSTTEDSKAQVHGPAYFATQPKVGSTTEDSKAQVHGPASSATQSKVGLTTEDNKADVHGPAFSTPIPLMDSDVKTSLSTTTKGVHDVSTSTTEQSHEEKVQHNFDSISKELGQKVVFAIRKQ